MKKWHKYLIMIPFAPFAVITYYYILIIFGSIIFQVDQSSEGLEMGSFLLTLLTVFGMAITMAFNYDKY